MKKIIISAAFLAMVAAFAGTFRRFLKNDATNGGPNLSFSTPFAEYLFADAGTIPALTESGLIALCAVTPSGTAWECRARDGGGAMAVTQGVGTTFASSFTNNLKTMTDLTDVKGPDATGSAVDAIFTGDFTVALAGYPTDRGSGFEAYGQFSGLNGGNPYGTKLRTDTVTLNVNVYQGSHTPTPAVTSNLNGWGVASIRRSTSTVTARVSGTDGTPVVQADTLLQPTGTYYFGSEDSSKDLRGPLAFTAFYNRALSSADLLGLENRFWGIPPGASVTSGNYANDNLDTSGQVDVYYSGAMVNGRGLRTVRDATATNLQSLPLDAGAWVDVGTPTMTANSSNGPFYEWKHLPTCWLMVDDSASVSEGKALTPVSTGNVTANLTFPYTTSAYVLAGTSGTTKDSVTIEMGIDGGSAMLLDGGTNPVCVFTGLTSTPTRVECTVKVSDGGVLYPKITVGAANTDTGSIQVCQGQTNYGPYAGVPALDTSVKGSSAQSLDVSNWPDTSKGGKYEVVFRPVHDANSQWGTTGDTIYLIDVYDVNVNHGVVMLFGYNNPGNALMRTENSDTGSTEFTQAGVVLVPGQLYAVSSEWRARGGGVCSVTWRFNSCTGSVSDCHATTQLATTLVGICPSTPANAKLGNRKDNTFPTDAYIAATRVYGAPQ